MNIPSVKIFPGIFILSFVFMSCGKKLSLFQQKSTSQNTYEKIALAKAPDPRQHIIAPGDIIYIDFFLKQADAKVPSWFNTDVTDAPPGIAVNEDGYLFIPGVGNILVGQKSIEDAQKSVTENLAKYYTDFELSLKLSSMRITMLGSVKNPGIINIPGDMPTLIDALGTVGDINNNGKPMNIKVLRNTPSGKKTILVDLSDLDFFLSEAYYLQSNDIIYVEKQTNAYLKENIQFLNIITTVVNLILIVSLRF